MFSLTKIFKKPLPGLPPHCSSEEVEGQETLSPDYQGTRIAFSHIHLRTIYFYLYDAHCSISPSMF